jgi:protein SCO1/2
MIPRLNRASVWLWAVIVFVAVIAIAGCSVVEEDRAESIRPIDYAAIKARLPPRESRGKVSDAFPNVSLTDQYGRTYRFFDDLVKEGPIVVNFMFTECALVCPGTTSNLARLHAAFGDAVGKDITFLSISLDPENDSQEDLHSYWKAFGSHEGWLYLRGDFEETELLRRSMGVYDLDPVVDADKTQHAGLLTFGNDATDRWAALPALSSIHDLKATIIRFALAGRLASRRRPDSTLVEIDDTQGKIYRSSGLIQSVDEKRREIILEHEAVPGLMPSMTMTFAVAQEIALDRFPVDRWVDFGLVNEATGFRVVEMVLQVEDTNSRIPPSALVAAGQSDYALYCASCHGPGGDGDGPMAGSLKPKPAKHSNGEYMNPLTDEYLFQVVHEGGASVGKSPMMAGWGGTLSDEQVLGLVAFMRSLAEPPYAVSP